MLVVFLMQPAAFQVITLDDEPSSAEPEDGQPSTSGTTMREASTRAAFFPSAPTCTVAGMAKPSALSHRYPLWTTTRTKSCQRPLVPRYMLGLLAGQSDPPQMSMRAGLLRLATP